MSSPETSHQIELERRCRVCAGILGTKSSPCSEKKNRELLKKFGIIVEQDRPDVHPTQLCFNCRSKAVQYSDRVNSSLVVFEWTPHTQDCEVCSFFSRQKREEDRKKRGKIVVDQRLIRFKESSNVWHEQTCLLTESLVLSPLIGLFHNSTKRFAVQLVW